MVKKPSWSWTQDRQWATSRLIKSADGRKWFEAPDGDAPKQMVWQLEVRTDDEGAGTQRMGEIVFTGTLTGDMTMRLIEEKP